MIEKENLLEFSDIGTVYWITGLSGAGKTTIGVLLYNLIKEHKDNIIFLDGDILREVYQMTNYGVEARKELALQYSRLCQMLMKQGMDVIICTIAMFDEIRDWNREHLTNYKEIYLKVTIEELIRRDQKQLYSRALRKEISNVMGVDIGFEVPKAPDLEIDNSGVMTPKEVLKEIADFCKIQLLTTREASEERKYWNEYYLTRPPVNTPSLFAQYVMEYVKEEKTLCELGCGNGRDSLFFASQGIKVVALDSAESVISILRDKGEMGVQFYCEDFIQGDILNNTTFDYIYSRFTLHSISEEEQAILLPKVYAALNKKGKFMIEVRGIHDDIFGRGMNVGRNAYIYENHYRRFIILEELVEIFKKQGYTILFANEQRGWAPYGKEDPVVIRVIAEK